MAPALKNNHSILVINPNTTASMTDALRPLIANLALPPTLHIDYFTAPPHPTTYPEGGCYDGIASINSGDDSCRSAMHVFPHVAALIDRYDGFLVACYSAHPLVGMLKRRIAQTAAEREWDGRRRFVVGIFEASVSAALSVTSHFDIAQPALAAEGEAISKRIGSQSFGIITTGAAWKNELENAVQSMLLRTASPGRPGEIFCGVETTGLSAIELHTTPAEVVEARIIAATQRLISEADGRLTAICLGCAGMSGMEAVVRRGCIAALGTVKGRQVYIIDAVVAGLGMLATSCRAGF
ncbi:hypothetical protein KEM52_006090 [Ascosphaera acerosa]|nr:hypothetical protein KEM52_006090 [Ascosphaera acerosa]